MPVELQRARRDPAGAGGNYGFMMAVTSNGGTGARPDKDGLSATAYPSGVRGTPVEIAESQTPLIFWNKELRPIPAASAARRAGMGRSSRSAAASIGRGISSRRSTASTIRRAGATVGATARPVTSA